MPWIKNTNKLTVFCNKFCVNIDFNNFSIIAFWDELQNAHVWPCRRAISFDQWFTMT